MNKIYLFLCLVWCSALQAQETYPTNGPADPRSNFHAFTNATIVTAPGQVLENATLIIKDGKIQSVSTSSAPQGAIVHDLSGKTIYPSFIELSSNYGVSNADLKLENRNWRDGQVFRSTKKGAFGWNETIHPEIDASSFFHSDSGAAEKMRSSGFGTVLTHVQDGIARGSGALVLLSDQSDLEVILNDNASQHFSFTKGSSSQSYPSSLMGSIALLRQSHYDAKWYATNNSSETNLTLKAWNENKALPAFFDANDPLNILRADKVGDEIGINFHILGNGEEYQRIKEIKQTGATVLVPLDFPAAFDVEDPLYAKVVSLKLMKHWEMAPYNAAFLEDEQVPFALSSHSLKDVNLFLNNVRKAVEKGLSEEKALEALTVTPARLVNAEGEVGTIQRGKRANFLITSGNIFSDKSAKIMENWVNGHQYALDYAPTDDIAGTYDLSVDGKNLELKITTKDKKPSFKVMENDSTELKSSGNYKNDVLSLFYTNDEGRVRLSGWKTGSQFKGSGMNANGEHISWSANKNSTVDEEMTDEEENADDDMAEETEENITLEDVMYPFMSYGWKTQPQQNKVLFKNATVWTNEADGILENTDVLIENGKIRQIGQDLRAGNAEVVDASGLHLTAGIIDEHSHICISRGVNEGTQASSAEVRIGDVVNSEHIALYRVLGGGVTSAQLLHGSANPIGGQSAIIKSRWGLAPEQMKFEGADEFIKFALGENVKQSNWGPQHDDRYPQTRMGVEQVYENYFTLAKEYEQNLQTNPNARRDLELEALLEIINRERFITCHSYVQSEINMLMNVAESFGFNVNTFTHILEGYKVADKMKEHGVGASTFSDWWAYKFEVNDAIPYNAAILAREGVVTAINSDDAEMARRLNQEAGKVVKYGGLSQEEAWKTVTLNPAKLLHIDDRVGSLKEGKDADVVLWSHNPLTVYARALETYVDGRKYFDAEEEKAKRKEIQAERQRLIQKMLNAKKGGADTQKAKKPEGQEYNCVHLGQKGLVNARQHH